MGDTRKKRSLPELADMKNKNSSLRKSSRNCTSEIVLNEVILTLKYLFVVRATISN